MKTSILITLLFIACQAFAQQAETARYEVDRWGKDQGCHFESFHEDGGMMVYETDQVDEAKSRLWDFVILDSCLYELKSDLISLPPNYSFFDSKSSSSWAAFLFMSEKNSRSDSIPFVVVTYNRVEQSYYTIFDRLPERTSLLSLSLIDNGLLLAANHRDGRGFLQHYDLNSQQKRVINPSISNNFILYQSTAVPEGKAFVVAAREYVDKHYKTTTFLVYSREGRLLKTHRFENVDNAVLGRMCFAFDDAHQLMVYSTLER
ncbi:MAG: hypothetical protein K6A28_00585, partial [Bacteroidales bacterium]|nr:hypothetical protein [Bacteroidales bacterium]